MLKLRIRLTQGGVLIKDGETVVNVAAGDSVNIQDAGDFRMTIEALPIKAELIAEHNWHDSRLKSLWKRIIKGAKS